MLVNSNESKSKDTYIKKYLAYMLKKFVRSAKKKKLKNNKKKKIYYVLETIKI